MPATTLLNDIALNLVFGGTAYPAKPATLYFALFTSTPNSGGGGAEVVGSGYTRKAVTANTTNFPAISTAGDNMTLDADIQWPLATGDWGTVVAWGIYDASTAGNLMFFDAVSSPVIMTNGMRPKIAASGLVLSMSGQFGNLLEKSLLNHIFAAVAWPATFGTHYFAVGTGATTAGLTTEAVGGSYARKSMTNNKTTYGLSSAGRVVNSVTIPFAAATASWGGTLDSWAIYDAATAGNCLWYGAIGVPLAISSGVYQWIAGELVLSLN
jgi:hypothetical protein